MPDFAAPLAGLLLCLGSFVVPSPAAQDDVAVTVRSQDGGVPLVAGARVAVTRWNGRDALDPDVILGGGGVETGEDGVAVVALPAGSGTPVVAVVAHGYAPSLAALSGDAAATVDLRLAASLRLRVERAAPARGDLPAAFLTVEAAAGALVEVRQVPSTADPEGTPRLLRRGRTDESGRLHVPDLARGPFWEVEVRLPGHAMERVSWVLAGGSPVRVTLRPEARLAGSVISVPAGKPVEGAAVSAGGVTALTDAEGRYVLAGLPEGRHRVRVEREGFVALEEHVVDGVPGRTTPVEDTRLAALGSVTIRVLDGDGAALEGVPVHLVRPLRPLRTESPPLSGPGGAVTLGGVAPGSGLRLLVDAPGPFAPRLTDAFAVLAGEKVDLGVLRLDRGGTLTGRVQGPDGIAVPAAMVTLAREGADPLRVLADPLAGGPLRRDLEVAADGTFRMDRVPGGHHVLLAHGPGRRATMTGTLDVVVGRAADTGPLVLEPGASLEGLLLDAEEKPVEDALLEARDGTSGVTGSARTGPGGRFRIEGLEAGTFDLRVVLPGALEPDPLEPPWRRVAPSAAVVLQLAPRFAISGVVRDPEGGTPPGRVVVARIRSTLGGPSSGPTGTLLDMAEDVTEVRMEDGRFTSVPLPPGHYRVRAETDDGRVAAADVPVVDMEPEPVVLTLDLGITVRGRLVGGSGVVSLAEAEVNLLVAGRAEAVVPTVRADASGVFIIRGVPPGEHDLVAVLPGHAPVVLRNMVVPEEEGVLDVGDLFIERGASLRVRVLDEDRRPAVDVLVSVVDDAGLLREERTGPSGVALFGGLREGVHVIEIQVPGGARYRRPVDLPADGEVDEEFDFGWMAPGVVHVRRGSGPVPGAAVRVLEEGPGTGGYAASVEVRTNDHGEARVPGMPEGPVLLEVTPPGEATVLVAAQGTDGVLEVELPTDGISVEVRAEEDNAPLPGACVTAWPEESGAGPVESALRAAGVGGRADAHGRYTFPSLAQGWWVLSVQAPGRATVDVGDLEVIAGGGLTPVRVLLPQAGSVGGTVFGPTGRPVAGAVVEVTDPETGRLAPGGRHLAGAGGRFLLEDLPPSSWVITARAGAVGASAPQQVTLGPREFQELDLHLQPGGTLVIRTVGLRGVPLPDAAISVFDALGYPVPLPEPPVHSGGVLRMPGRTGPHGELRVPGLRTGVYIVRAEAAGLDPAEVRVRVQGSDGVNAVLALVPPARTLPGASGEDGDDGDDADGEGEPDAGGDADAGGESQSGADDD